MTALVEAPAALLTPVENRAGRYYKREDLHRADHGVNGAKLRACQHLIGEAARAGKGRVVSAASVLSPQSAMAAVVAAENAMACTVIIGGSNPASAMKHPSMMIAAQAGAEFRYVPVGYNPFIQARARELVADDPSAYHLQYGITTQPGATVEQLRAFHATGGRQVANLPESVTTIVLPFGSGNSAAGVLYGLARHPEIAARVRRLVLMGIGPNRQAWLEERLSVLGVPKMPVAVSHMDLHGSGYAKYGDKMPETRDGIRFHPTYEGKVVRYLDEVGPAWWRRRDGSTCLWIVGGPLPKTRR